jgi:hypothetical protein
MALRQRVEDDKKENDSVGVVMEDAHTTIDVKIKPTMSETLQFLREIAGSEWTSERAEEWRHLLTPELLRWLLVGAARLPLLDGTDNRGPKSTPSDWSVPRRLMRMSSVITETLPVRPHIPPGRPVLTQVYIRCIKQSTTLSLSFFLFLYRPPSVHVCACICDWILC